MHVDTGLLAVVGSLCLMLAQLWWTPVSLMDRRG
jgi:hypothetical protein